MKKLILLIGCLCLITGCEANESKEGRIRKLESESERTSEALQELKDRVEAIESNSKKGANEK